MKTKKQILEVLEKITDEYGQLHEVNCELNNEDGSFDGCNCAMKSLIKEISNFIFKEKQEFKKVISEEVKKYKCGKHKRLLKTIKKL